MIRTIISIVILLVGFCIQVVVFPYITLWGVKGDLLFILVVYFSLVRGWKTGMFLGVLAGILQDSFSVGKTGILTLTLTGIFVGAFHKALFTDNLVSKIIIFVFIAAWYFFLSFFILKVTQYTYSGFIGDFLPPYLLYNAIVAVVVFSFLEKISGEI